MSDENAKENVYTTPQFLQTLILGLANLDAFLILIISWKCK